MTKISQNTNEICNRYANALIISASNKNELNEISENFTNFVSTIEESQDFLKFIGNPLINSKKYSSLILKEYEKI